MISNCSGFLLNLGILVEFVLEQCCTSLITVPFLFIAYNYSVTVAELYYSELGKYQLNSFIYREPASDLGPM